MLPILILFLPVPSTAFHSVPSTTIPARVQAAAQAGGSMFSPVSLAFLDLNYAVIVGRGKARSEKTVIDNVSGYVKRGSFVAIMGPSGTE